MTGPIFKASGVPLFKSAGIPAMDPSCCCCVCTEVQGTVCKCIDSDFETFQTPKSIQMDINLYPGILSESLTYSYIRDSSLCGPDAVITPPNINGSYIFNPTTANNCGSTYCKRVSTEICTAVDFPPDSCTSGWTSGPPPGIWHLMMVTDLTISVSFVLNALLTSYTYAEAYAIIESKILWVHDDLMSLTSSTGETCPQISGQKQAAFPGCGYGTGLRKIYFKFPTPDSQLAYYQYIPSASCLPSCNSVKYTYNKCTWGTPTITDFPMVESHTTPFGDTVPHFGGNYNGSGITVSQL